MSALHSMKTSERKQAANRGNALRSTGPRTSAGKRRARLNALKNGQRARTLAGDGLAPGDDPRAFERWRGDFVAGFAPQEPLEAHLVEELARLGWKRRRVERAQAALQAREVEKLELATLRQLHALNQESLDISDAEMVEHGLLGAKDCTAKFEEALNLLDQVIEQVEKEGPTDSLEGALRTLYGQCPPWRGGLVLTLCRRIRNGEATEGVPEESMQAGLLQLLHEERRDLLEQYELLRFEQVEITTPLREACLAPSDPRWPLLLRQEAMIERQIDRRLRLLERLLRGRQRHGSGGACRSESEARSQESEGSLRKAEDRNLEPKCDKAVTAKPAPARALTSGRFGPRAGDEPGMLGPRHASRSQGVTGRIPVLPDAPVGEWPGGPEATGSARKEEKKSTNEANKLMKTKHRVYKRTQTKPTVDTDPSVFTRRGISPMPELTASQSKNSSWSPPARVLAGR